MACVGRWLWPGVGVARAVMDSRVIRCSLYGDLPLGVHFPLAVCPLSLFPRCPLLSPLVYCSGSRPVCFRPFLSSFCFHLLPPVSSYEIDKSLSLPLPSFSPPFHCLWHLHFPAFSLWPRKAIPGEVNDPRSDLRNMRTRGVIWIGCHDSLLRPLLLPFFFHCRDSGRSSSNLYAKTPSRVRLQWFMESAAAFKAPGVCLACRRRTIWASGRTIRFSISPGGLSGLSDFFLLLERLSSRLDKSSNLVNRLPGLSGFSDKPSAPWDMLSGFLGWIISGGEWGAVSKNGPIETSQN